MGAQKDGTIDKRILGSWTCSNPEDAEKTAKLWVIPFDDHQYYAEWREGDEVTRYRAYSSKVGNQLLLNVEEVTFKFPSVGWIFVRAVRGADQRLTLDIVDGDALKKEGRAALGEVRRRASDPSLYKRWATCSEDQ